MWPTILLAVSLLAVSAGMMALHVRAWRGRREEASGEADRDFYRSQFRRRMQTSALVGVVGLALVAGLWIEGPLTMLCFWGGVLAVALWIAALAIADAVRSGMHFRFRRRELDTERALLENELREVRGRLRDTNGHS
jgi:hypothetical protein